MGYNWNGSTDALSRTSNLPGITSFTMMAWVRWTSYSSWHIPLVYGHATTSGLYYAMGTTGSTGPNDLFIGNSAAAWYGAVPTTGTWYHLCMTVAGTGAGQFLGYRDGSLVLTGNGSTGPTSGKIWIGNNQDGDYLNGDVCAVKIYAAVLTAAEIQQEMRQIAPVRTANLNTWLPLVDGSPTVDYSGNGYNMTSGGTLTFTSNPPVPWRCGPRRMIIPASAPPASGGYLPRGQRFKNRVLTRM